MKKIWIALMGLMPNLWTAAIAVLAFYVAYYVYEPPYRGLYPDLLPPSMFGRAQGVQHLLRGAALGIALGDEFEDALQIEKRPRTYPDRRHAFDCGRLAFLLRARASR